ncbi:MAG: hypothetical protein LPK45_09330 [Bacteroidota bacterium]|nr:hypothetical protein [Bacteroidota bacterium]MDX5431287.1 hypothetical protein [Bacteroidota bacterium]MDX5470025.1 hypothetical protein [Bacteroidota bacterium]
MLILLLASEHTAAQTDRNWVSNPDTGSFYKVTFYHNHYLIGKIKSINERELILFVTGRGETVIPVYEIKSIVLVPSDRIDPESNLLIGEDQLPSYILNTAAFGPNKGEVIVGCNTIGPEIHLGLSNHVSFRLTTTWVASPVMANLTYSIPFNKKTHLQLGVMGAWGSWNVADEGVGLPYAGLTFGRDRRHLTLTGGFGQYFSYLTNNNLWYAGISGCFQVSNRFDLVFDSYLSEYSGSYGRIINGTMTTSFYSEANGMALLAGRLHFAGNDYLQFGGGVLSVWGEPLPFPLIQYFHRFN